MKTETWELIKNITCEYATYTDFDFEEIISDYNKDNETTYTLEDIEDFYVKWNDLNLEMNDWVTIVSWWVSSDWDWKRPDVISYNNFD